MVTIRTFKGVWKGERMRIRGFKTLEAMHKFLNTGDNAVHWRQTNDDTHTTETHLKPGLYAYAGGAWHNVKSLDPTVLAHI